MLCIVVPILSDSFAYTSICMQVYGSASGDSIYKQKFDYTYIYTEIDMTTSLQEHTTMYTHVHTLAHNHTTHHDAHRA